MLNQLQEGKVFPNVQDQIIRVAETGTYRNFLLLNPQNNWHVQCWQMRMLVLCSCCSHAPYGQPGRPGTMSTILHPGAPFI